MALNHYAMWVQFEQNAHRTSHVVVNVAVSQICGAVDEDATTILTIL